MKKNLIIALTLALATTACGGNIMAEKANESIVSTANNLVENYIDERGTYTDDSGNNYEYSYHVPKLIANSKDAQEINKEIGDYFDKIVSAERENIQNCTSLGYYKIDWKSSCNQNILSLVIYADTDFGFTDYFVYNYGIKENKRLDDKALLTYLNMSEDTFLDNAKKVIVREYEKADKETDLSDEYLDFYYKVILGCKFHTLSQFKDFSTYMKEKVNPTSDSLYLDDNGHLNMILKDYSPAGADWYYKDIQITSNKPQPVTKTITDKFITAELTGNDVFITFQDALITFPSEADAYKLEYGKKYKVNGLHSSYKDIYIGTIETAGQGYFPYLILTTDQDTLEFVNILEGATNDYLCGGLPIIGVSGQLQLTNDIAAKGEYRTIFATNTATNEKYNLAKWITAAERSFPIEVDAELNCSWLSEKVTHTVASGGAYQTTYFLQFSPNGELMYEDINEETETFITYKGYTTFLGSTDEDYLYAYHLNNEENPQTSFNGILAIKISSLNYDKLEARSLTGPNLFDQKDNTYLPFTRSFG